MTAGVRGFVVALMLATSHGTQATEQYRVADAMVDMAEVLIRGRDLLNEAADTASKKANPIERDFEALLGYEKAIIRFTEARDIITPFAASRMESVKEWAEVAGALCRALEGAFSESLKLTTEAMQTESVRALEALIPKMAATTGRIDEIWRTFPKLMGLASHIVHDEDRTDANGKASFLRISLEEKQLLLKRLDAMALESDANGNTLAVEAGLRMFRDFLREPWKH